MCSGLLDVARIEPQAVHTGLERFERSACTDDGCRQRSARANGARSGRGPRRPRVRCTCTARCRRRRRREGVDLLERRVVIGRLGHGHRLHRDGSATAHRHVADHDLASSLDGESSVRTPRPHATRHPPPFWCVVVPPSTTRTTPVRPSPRTGVLSCHPRPREHTSSPEPPFWCVVVPPSTTRTHQFARAPVLVCCRATLDHENTPARRVGGVSRGRWGRRCRGTGRSSRWSRGS